MSPITKSQCRFTSGPYFPIIFSFRRLPRTLKRNNRRNILALGGGDIINKSQKTGNSVRHTIIVLVNLISPPPQGQIGLLCRLLNHITHGGGGQICPLLDPPAPVYPGKAQNWLGLAKLLRLLFKFICEHFLKKSRHFHVPPPCPPPWEIGWIRANGR